MRLYIFILSLFCSYLSFSQTKLTVPDTLSGTSFSLEMRNDSVQFFPTGEITKTYAYNNFSYLGPTLIWKNGDSINITVKNSIEDTTTVHWHGIHLPSKWDGGPHTVIPPNESWYPKFKVLDNASTYWYHPHLHEKTAEQAIKGAVGFIIVRDSIEGSLNLPRTYGTDDFPLVIQCAQFDDNNQPMPLGMQDSTLIVNGARSNNGYAVFAEFPAQIVRLRMLNGSGERAFNFGFSGNKQFYHIGSDGGLLDSAYLTDRIRLAPGERAEILLDLNGMQGDSLYLMSYASEMAMGIQGGPTMPMPPGSPPMDSPLNGIDFNIFKIKVVAQTANPITTVPQKLTTNTILNPADANITRTIRFTADSSMVMDGPFYFNGNSFDMMRIDYEIPLNNIEIWKLVNETMVAHPFHIHDVQFRLFERSGSALTNPSEMGRKDVVLVPPYDSVSFITKFEDFVDDMIPFMFHCHILMHEDDGMMGQFLVKTKVDGIQKTVENAISASIYPNPAQSILNIKLHNIHNSKNTQLLICDSMGKKVFNDAPLSDMVSINTENWATGIYIVNIISDNQIIKHKISIVR